MDWRIPSCTRPGRVRQVGCVAVAVERSTVGEGVRVCCGLKVGGLGVALGTGAADGEQAVKKASSSRSIVSWTLFPKLADTPDTLERECRKCANSANILYLIGGIRLFVQFALRILRALRDISLSLLSLDLFSSFALYSCHFGGD